MKSLKNTTLIIPIKIDSKDRIDNLNYNLTYLNANFKTNVIISEQGNYIDLIKINLIDKFKNINFRFLKNNINTFFHKTKYLNQMLDITQTPVVCCYDVDSIFDSQIYLDCEQSILNDEFDMIYPFGKGYYQIEILKETDKTSFLKDPCIKRIFSDQKNFINFSPFLVRYAEYGHAVFFNTKKYQNLGGENENYRSWGPEDKERYYKFQRLGLKISWSNNMIYHFDHERTQDSGYNNPFFQANDDLFNTIHSMNEIEFINYYKNQEFYQHYNNIKFNYN